MKSLSRRACIAAFVAAWVTAPSFPSIVCALTMPTSSASALVEMPDCHSASAREGASNARAGHRACCEDVATSCCLRALDVDGAVGGLVTLDSPPQLAITIEAPVPALRASFLSPVCADSRAQAPPGSLFRVLRL